MSELRPQPENTPILPFYYVMVVWGEKYVDMLLDVTLPCLLSPGNLPALPNRAESRFLIMTTAADRERILGSPVYAELNGLVQVDFVEAPWLESDVSRYTRASRGHQEGARIAAANDAYCVFLVPDILVSDGALPFLHRTAQAGKQAVMVPGIRVTKESILREIQSSPKNRTGAALEFTARELVGLGMRHVHPGDQLYNWDNPHFSKHPVICTWTIGKEPGLLIRAFHLHPILVKVNTAESVKLLDTNTIDDEFLGLNFPDWDAIHVETDSDNIVLFSLTEADERNVPLAANTATVEKIRAVAYGSLSNPLHRYYFTKAIKLHAEDLNEDWEQAQRETGLLAYDALRLSGTGMTAVLQYVDGRTMVRALAARIKSRVLGFPGKLLSRLTS